ncbi:ABC transporter substrate-binding protein [Reinekea sp. G2M2-21]|uniref:substrate-binding periplasmic protein n=1 Tax=Reinekea sp. G2M2-21 TaxID=2788942 RepID=UPI0018A96EF6|nr:transporter substrate-binding domain-containing protein [Reinekea sp. G2M2-21]
MKLILSRYLIFACISVGFAFAKRRILYWLLCTFIAIAHSSLYAEEPLVKLVIAYENKTQFPYYLGDSQHVLDEPGAAVDIVQLLPKRIPGIEIELVRYPWSRCLALLAAGQVDAIFNASYSESRAEYGVYPHTDDDKLDDTRRLTTISYSWYALKGNENQTVEKVVAPQGYSINEQMRARGYTLYEAAQSSSALRMLQAGHVNRAALQTVTGDYLLANDRTFDNIVRLDPPLVIKPYFLLFGRRFYEQHPNLTEAIWTELAQLRETQLPERIEHYLQSEGR